MAFELNDLNATIKKSIFPTVIDIVFKDILLVHLLLRRNKVVLKSLGPDGYVDQPILVGKTPVFHHDNRMGKLEVPVQDIMGSARYRLSNLYSSLSLTRDDEMICDSTDKVLDTLKVRIEDAKTSLIDQIETELFQQTTASKGADVDSLAKIVDDGSIYPVYCDVPRATYEGYKSYVKNMGGVAVQYMDLLTTFRKAKIGETEKPTLIFAHGDQWDKLNNILFNKQTVNVMPMTRDDYIYNLGYDNFKMFGAPVVACDRLNPGEIVFLNEKFLQLSVWKSADEKGMTFMPFERISLSTIKASHFMFDGQLVGIPRYHSKIINAG